MSKRNSWLVGLVAGLIVLALVLLPLFGQRLESLRLQRVSQSSLVEAGGNGREMMPMQPLLILPKQEGSLPAGTAVSLSGHRWYQLPAGGVVPEEDAAIWRDVYVTYGNRMAITPIDDEARQSHRIAVDLSPAPKVAELVFFESIKPGEAVVLPVRNATEAELIHPLPGLEYTLKNDQVTLLMPQDMMQRRFFCFRVLVKNDHGHALCMVAVLPEQAKEYIPVRSAAELQAIHLKPEGCYRLMNDIDLGELAWQPIGSEPSPFCGLVDGGGHAITGLHWPPGDGSAAPDDPLDRFALFGYVKYGIIRNLRIINPQIDGRGVDEGLFPAAALALHTKQSLVENCQVLGGQVITGRNGAAGVVLEAWESVLLHLFNSSEVTALMPASMMHDSGGVAGVMNGYMAYCANEGKVSASHLTGGLFGWGNSTALSHCINSGEINGVPFIGAYPPGALFQTLDGDYASACCFVQGNAARAGSAYLQSGISNIRVIGRGDLQNVEVLDVLGAFEGEDAPWMLDEAIAEGPIPRGIYTMKLYRPGGEMDE